MDRRREIKRLRASIVDEEERFEEASRAVQREARKDEDK